jgi:hypothetical protein
MSHEAHAAGTPRTALVLLTHRFDAPILDEFSRMRRALLDGDTAFVASDAARIPDTLDAKVHRFVFADIARRASRLVEDGILRNLHLAWIDFFDAHPGFDHYWFIEYDVRYSGPWHELIDAFRNQPHDLLCAHLRDAVEEPDWHWWREIVSPQGVPERASLLRGFLPVARLSRDALQTLASAIASGWSGFLEGLIPTLMQDRGLRIGDFGGDGRFVPEGFRNRFYTSFDDREGSLCGAGTHRFRPALAYPRIQPGRIWHPVKPEHCLVDAGIDAEHAGAAIGNLLEHARQVRERQRAPVEACLQALAGIDTASLRTIVAELERKHSSDIRYARLRERLDQLVDAPA